jgi:hypothetical protein
MLMHGVQVLTNENKFEEALKKAFDAKLVKGFMDVLRSFFVYYDFRSESIYINPELNDANIDHILKNTFEYNSKNFEGCTEDDEITLKRKDCEGILSRVINYCVDKDLPRLLKFVRDNNTTSKKSEVSQRLLKIIIRQIGIHRVTEYSDKLKEDMESNEYTFLNSKKGETGEDDEQNLLSKFFDSIEAYTERHFDRLKGFYKKACYLDFVLAQSGLLYAADDVEK